MTTYYWLLILALGVTTSINARPLNDREAAFLQLNTQLSQRVFEHSGDYEQAIVALQEAQIERALEHPPKQISQIEYRDLLFYYAKLLNQDQQNQQKAYQLIKRLLKQQPNRLDLLEQLAYSPQLGKQDMAEIKRYVALLEEQQASTFLPDRAVQLLWPEAAGTLSDCDFIQQLDHYALTHFFNPVIASTTQPVEHWAGKTGKPNTFKQFAKPGSQITRHQLDLDNDSMQESAFLYQHGQCQQWLFIDQTSQVLSNTVVDPWFVQPTLCEGQQLIPFRFRQQTHLLTGSFHKGAVINVYTLGADPKHQCQVRLQGQSSSPIVKAQPVRQKNQAFMTETLCEAPVCDQLIQLTPVIVNTQPYFGLGQTVSDQEKSSWQAQPLLSAAVVHASRVDIDNNGSQEVIIRAWNDAFEYAIYEVNDDQLIPYDALSNPFIDGKTWFFITQHDNQSYWVQFKTLQSATGIHHEMDVYHLSQTTKYLGRITAYEAGPTN